MVKPSATTKAARTRLAVVFPLAPGTLYWPGARSYVYTKQLAGAQAGNVADTARRQAAYYCCDYLLSNIRRADRYSRLWPRQII